MRVVVVGAGLIGLTSAYYLQRQVAQVTVLEREAGPGQGTSFANGALLHPSLVDPWNAPGVLGFLLRNLGRDDSPMLLRARALPSLVVRIGRICSSTLGTGISARRLRQVRGSSLQTWWPAAPA